jgi:hypothetical protein
LSQLASFGGAEYLVCSISGGVCALHVACVLSNSGVVLVEVYLNLVTLE